MSQPKLKWRIRRGSSTMGRRDWSAATGPSDRPGMVLCVYPSVVSICTETGQLRAWYRKENALTDDVDAMVFLERKAREFALARIRADWGDLLSGELPKPVDGGDAQ